MTTVLDKELKRQISVDGADYTLSLDASGFRLTSKGRRKPEVELRWRDLLNGDAAMALALNASVARQSPTPRSQDTPTMPTRKKVAIARKR